MFKIVFRSEFKILYDVFVQILLNAEKKIPVEISINPVDSGPHCEDAINPAGK